MWLRSMRKICARSICHIRYKHCSWELEVVEQKHCSWELDVVVPDVVASVVELHGTSAVRKVHRASHIHQRLDEVIPHAQALCLASA